MDQNIFYLKGGVICSIISFLVILLNYNSVSKWQVRKHGSEIKNKLSSRFEPESLVLINLTKTRIKLLKLSKRWFLNVLSYILLSAICLHQVADSTL